MFEGLKKQFIPQPEDDAQTREKKRDRLIPAGALVGAAALGAVAATQGEGLPPMPEQPTLQTVGVETATAQASEKGPGGVTVTMAKEGRPATIHMPADNAFGEQTPIHPSSDSEPVPINPK